jgi:hypothetical protein
MENRIFKTYDYEIFKFKEENREINEIFIQKLCKSIMQNDLTKNCPIIVDDKMNIIDGQHRYEACKRLNIPIHYIKSDSDFSDSVALINNVSHRWTMMDYIKFWSVSGKENYKKLYRIIKKNELGIDKILYLLGFNGGSELDKIRAGNMRTTVFENPNFEEEMNEKIESFNQIIDTIKEKTYLKGNHIKSKRFFLSMIFVMRLPNFDLKKMKMAIIRNPDKLSESATILQYKKKIIDLYNSYSRKDKIGLEIE